jgi:hypothetical protein
MASAILRYDDQAWLHRCPGCQRLHVIPDYGNVRWTFNGDYEKPTFSPSVRHSWSNRGDGGPDKCCHYFIRDGRIEFCGDCTHPLSGQTVDLPPLENPVSTDTAQENANG